MMSDFHLIRPLWLLAIPALLAIWWMGTNLSRGSLWEHHISKDLIAALRINNTTTSSRWRWLILAAWILLSIAMAGPSWLQTPLPTMTNQQALVLALDLSPSMNAKDLAPDRLTRAKYKMIDILRMRKDSQVALIAYAGDAHTVSPLTDDPATIEALLVALSPAMMPSSGSNTEAAIELANDLLQQAKVTSGEVLLITDGVTQDAQNYLRENANSRHRISVLALGSSNGAPIPASNGGFLKTVTGEIVLASVNHDELSKLADNLGGRYSALQNDDSDINYLLASGPNFDDEQRESDSVVYDSWVDMGHWIVLLILPFAAYCFRKGLIFVLPILLFQPLDSQAAWYDQLGWQDLWQTKNQQAKKLMEQQQYEQAAQTFNDPNWSAVAQYRNGQYDQASASFKDQESLRNLYNTGNALALQGDLENAISAYEQVLEQAPQHDDAAHNLSIVEQMLAQNQQQSQQQESQDSDEQSEQQDGDASEQQSDDSQQPQQSESGQSEQDQQQQSEQQQGDAQQQENQQKEEEQPNQQSEEQQSPQQQAEQQSSEQDSEQEQQQASSEQQTDQQQGQPEQTDSQTDEGEQQDESSAEVRDQQQPLQDASEQWLRTIQDDPSGLLKRKFEYQAWQRSRQAPRSRQQPAEKQNRY